MSQLADFSSQLDGDAVHVPPEVVALLRDAGITEVRVRLEAPAAEPGLLGARGIEESTVRRVAEVQKIDRETAAIVLAGEGIAHESPLGDRLLSLTEETGGRNSR
jgi:hypothetical protein